ncbi:short-chain dehydrogenase/reductase SDR (plasmid) [Rhizobium leguminosarum bv. trifolii WSM2304]|uniref:Short-chain dehydrogenase/reductase SDR n=1 Tax=Rhizobium leguminosarum bv. trifolii (strain WSM2304) TaxID=395492 RepID=A0ABF7QZ58_RHILW|nr:SDR family oxidoreductase [Rhizobium leguminosarum]ACI59469.1 short-chain dehydrogenase/reductase SDR [Rhizobium leguminosarum bv. trifolii WSM2304]
MPTENIDKKKVVVTGGASGIGMDIAALLLSRDWEVHLIDLKLENLQLACDILGLSHGNAHVADVSDEQAIGTIFETLTRTGPLSALVNSAGIGVDKLVVDTDVADFRRMFDVNLVGTFLPARAAARHWLASGLPGAIVNVSSVSGILGSKGRGAYGASKAAVNQLTRIFATELGPKGIRVNAVAPGAIETPLSRAVHTEDVRRQWKVRIPLARYGSVREIAVTVAFLISDEASYINGQILAVDGGFSSAGLMVEP